MLTIMLQVGSVLSLPTWQGALAFSDNPAVLSVATVGTDVVLAAVATGTANVTLVVPFWGTVELAVTVTAPAGSSAAAAVHAIKK